MDRDAFAKQGNRSSKSRAGPNTDERAQKAHAGHCAHAACREMPVNVRKLNDAEEASEGKAGE